MIKCKPALTAAAVALLFVNGYSFAGKKSNTIYYYKSGTHYQRLESGHTTEGDLRERSITFKTFTDTNNWTTEEQGSCSSSIYDAFIYSISFNEELTDDGDSDGQLTLQEAIDIVYARFTQNDSRPNNTLHVNASVHVVATDAVH
jgi:hypothetical protein